MKFLKVILGFIGLLALVLVVKIVVLPLFVADQVVESGKGVVSKTLDSDNVIFNYENFHNLYQGAKQQAANIQNTDKSIQNLKDTYGEPSTWNEETQKENQHLQENKDGYLLMYQKIVSEYNADSAKLNRKLFKDKNLPAELSQDYTQLQ